jgi:hypothetical protein
MGRYLSVESQVSVRFFNRVDRIFPEIQAPSVDFSEEVVLFNKEQTDELYRYCHRVVDAYLTEQPDAKALLAEAFLIISSIGEETSKYEIDHDPEMTGEVDWADFFLVFA